jgi:acyl-CoA dehydrogenase
MQYEGATGWLVGEPHSGMAAMFTMMNNARLGVGVQGVSVAEAAYQQASITPMNANRAAARWTAAPARSSIMPMCVGC